MSRQNVENLYLPGVGEAKMFPTRSSLTKVWCFVPQEFILVPVFTQHQTNIYIYIQHVTRYKILFLYICKHLMFGAFLHVDEVEDIFWSNDHFATYHYITSWFIVWYASREQIWCGGAARARTLEVPAGGEIQVMAMAISRDMTPTRLLCLVNPVATGPANANGGAYTAIVLRNWSHWKALQSHNDSTWRFTVHSEVWGIKCINSIPIFSITCGLNYVYRYFMFTRFHEKFAPMP